MFAAMGFLLHSTPKFMDFVEQKFNNTYHRFNKELKVKEMLGYGGENESMWTGAEQYFGHQMREDSIFGK